MDCPGDWCTYTVLGVSGTLRDWEVLGEWLAAVGTIAAVVLALWLGLAEQRRAHREARARAQREERAQADAVAAWITTDWSKGQPRGAVFIRNDSPLPIWDVRVSWWALDFSGDENRARINLAVLAPGETHEHASLHVSYDEPRELLEVRFVDAAQRAWVRRPDGQLERVTAPPPRPTDALPIEQRQEHEPDPGSGSAPE